MKIYLRVLDNKAMDLFDGDVEKDRKYWEKYHNSKARYFELEEIKTGDENMRIHKRYQKNVAVGETVKCGLFVGYLPEENTTFIWNKVTCKNCLKLRN